MMPCYIYLFNWTKLMMETVNKMCLTTFVHFKYLPMHNFAVCKIFDNKYCSCKCFNAPISDDFFE